MEAQQRSPGAPRQLPGLGQLPSAPSSRPDSAATPRGIGRPPVRDHNMLMHGVCSMHTYPHATPPRSPKHCLAKGTLALGHACCQNTHSALIKCLAKAGDLATLIIVSILLLSAAALLQGV